MTLENNDLESIKKLLETSSFAPQNSSPSALFDLEARDRTIQTNELLKQQQVTLEKSLELIESKLDSTEKKLEVIETILQESRESAKLFDTRYASLARWLNHYQTWSILLAIATVASVILGLRYFPF
jgi:DNA-binding transcriptional MerR regulator